MSDFIPIKGYEQYYSISRTGEVMSHFYGIILKHGMASGYPRVQLYRPGKKKPKSHLIHRLLAEHFISNPNQLPYVNHINGDTSDFRIANLEWVDASYNVQDGYNRGRVAPNKGTKAAHLIKACENCGDVYIAKRKVQRFCSNRCSARARIAIELFKQGVLMKESNRE